MTFHVHPSTNQLHLLTHLSLYINTRMHLFLTSLFFTCSNCTLHYGKRCTNTVSVALFEGYIINMTITCMFLLGEMIFDQPCFDNFYDNFISHTHMIILLSLSIDLIFVPLSKFLCKIWLSNKLSQEIVVEITLLFF